MGKGHDEGELSLRDLHALVPAAEAIDLIEDDAIEQARRYREVAVRDVLELINRLGSEDVSGGEPVPGDEMTEPDDPEGPVDPVTPGQAMGMLEHLLGAEPVEDPEGPGRPGAA